jgi:hypothetical protein
MDICLTSDTSVFKLDKSDVPILRRLGGSLELILQTVTKGCKLYELCKFSTIQKIVKALWTHFLRFMDTSIILFILIET